MGLINLGAGLSAFGGAIADTAGHLALEQQKSDLERQALTLSSQLASERQHQQNIESGLPLDVAAKRLSLGISQARYDDLYGGTTEPQAAVDSGAGQPSPTGTADAMGAPTSLPEPGSPAQVAPAGAAPANPKRLTQAFQTLTSESVRPLGMTEAAAHFLLRQEPEKYLAAVLDSFKTHDLRQGGEVVGRGGEGGLASLYAGKNPNQPFNSDGTPNQAFQDWELKKKEDTTPTGFQRNADKSLAFIPGGPADPATKAVDAKAVADATMDPDAIHTMAELYANYDAPLPTGGFALGKPSIQAAIKEAKQINPDFDATKYQQKQASKRSFASGQDGRNVQSVGVALQHLDVLQNAMTALDNGDIPALNVARNWWLQNTGSPLPNTPEAIKSIVGAEITKAVTPSGGGVTDREETRKTLNTSSSPGQVAGAIGAYKALMVGQLRGLQKKYEFNTGSNDFEKMLLPEAAALLHNANAPSDTGGMPTPKSAAERDALPAGTTYLAPDGSTRVR